MCRSTTANWSVYEASGAESVMRENNGSKRNGFGSFPNRSWDSSRIVSVTGSVFEEEPPELKIQAANMPIEMQRSAMFSATQAIKLYGTEKHIAESIKQEFG
ncbi:dynein light chain LC6, flagellar outer arm [Trichonephila clavata]|uniref:Dynein light chain LC6, flagellar outer arm n=1 Tax=Trichonephila clavata TaxID=2740835 RepID=A0A8X6HBN5_TRICU|nr:dynein light chain LC6, flagellar outer arm [Trichonephila clavata]